MTKTEVRNVVDAGILWQLNAIKGCIDRNQFRWEIDERCCKILGMLSLAEDLHLLTYEEWENCMLIVCGLQHQWKTHDEMM